MDSIGHGTQGWYGVRGKGLVWISGQEDNLKQGTRSDMDIELVWLRDAGVF